MSPPEPTDRGSLLRARRAWGRLPWRRRRSFWNGTAVPEDDDEAAVIVGFVRYVRSVWGTLEWAVAGLLGFVGGMVLSRTFGGGFDASAAGFVGQAIAWVGVWTLVGAPLRRARADRIERRVRSDHRFAG